MTRKHNPDRRTRDLAQIHLGAKALGMDRDTYESMLWTLCRVRSAGDLDSHGRMAVIAHLKKLGFKPRPSRPRPPAERAPLLGKVRAMLAAAGRDETYGDAMARRMFNVERLSWLQPDQLRRVVAALNYDAKRRANKGE